MSGWDFEIAEQAIYMAQLDAATIAVDRDSVSLNKIKNKKVVYRAIEAERQTCIKNINDLTFRKAEE